MFRNPMDRWFAAFRASGDPRAIARVFDRAAPELWRVAAHLCRDRHTAEDALQSTFLAAIEQREQWDAARPVLPWLLGLLANRVREERRRSTRRADPERLTAPSAAAEPCSSAASHELDGALRQALETMGEPYRRTLELYLVHDLAAHEIAAREHVAAGTVRMRLHRGLDQLRRRLPKGLVAGGLAGALLGPVGSAAIRATVVAAAASAKGATLEASTGVAARGIATNARRTGLAPSSIVVVGVLAFVVVWAAGLGSRAAGSAVAAPSAAGAGDVAARQSPSHERASSASPDRSSPSAPLDRAIAPAVLGQVRVTALGVGRLEPVPGAHVVARPGGVAPVTAAAAGSPANEHSSKPRGPRAHEPSDHAPREAATHRARTDEDGVALLALPVGRWRIDVCAEGLDGGAHSDVEVLAGACAEPIVVVPVPMSVDVAVVDTAGAPIAGARIVGRSRGEQGAADVELGTTGTDGRWHSIQRWQHLLVRAFVDGRAASRCATLRPGSTSATLRIEAPAAAIDGVVVDAVGNALAGATVALQRDSEHADELEDGCRIVSADARGRFAVAQLRAGRHRVYAWSGTREPRCFACVPVSISAGGEHHVRIVLDDGASGDSGPGIDLEVMQPDGAACSGAMVVVSALRQPTDGVAIARVVAADDAGMAQIRGLPAGEYELRLGSPLGQRMERIEIPVGPPLQLRRMLGGRHWVEVQVRTADGAPLPGIVVHRQVMQEAPTGRFLVDVGDPVECDEEGVVRCDLVADERSWVAMHRAGCRLPCATVEVATDRRTVVSLTDEQLAFGSVRGRLVFDGGAGTTAAVVQLTPAARGGMASSTAMHEVDAGLGGGFEFADVPPGVYNLLAYANVRAARGTQWLAIRESLAVEPGAVLELGEIAAAASSVRCDLSRRDGAPVGNARALVRIGPWRAFSSKWSPEPMSDRLHLDGLPTGQTELLLLADDCAPTVRRVTLPRDAGRVDVVAEPAATVTVRFEAVPASRSSGVLSVRRADGVRAGGGTGSLWFVETLTDARLPYRCGLPPGTYRIEFVSADVAFVADAAVGTEPVQVVGRRAHG